MVPEEKRILDISSISVATALKTSGLKKHCTVNKNIRVVCPQLGGMPVDCYIIYGMKSRNINCLRCKKGRWIRNYSTHTQSFCHTYGCNGNDNALILG